MSADKTKSNQFTITINPGNKSIRSTGNEELLTLLAENSILLRSDCGGKGVCKKCMVNIIPHGKNKEAITACTCRVTSNLTVEIPQASLMSAHIVTKAQMTLPYEFTARFQGTSTEPLSPGIAVDLGTTTIALYLMDITRGEVLSSLAIKNPQSLYGSDVVSRIGYIGNDAAKLSRLHHLVTGAIRWGAKSLVKKNKLSLNEVQKFVIVGNPAMIHIFLGISPYPIGVSPYKPAFFKPQTILGCDIDNSLSQVAVQTLPQISGFIGGDILAAAIACELTDQPTGTLLIDLGTNGELIMKCRDGFIATSCATGPAFEGATLSCGIQAIPGAIDRIEISDERFTPRFTTINSSDVSRSAPIGICGSGIISGVASFLRSGVIKANGAFATEKPITHLQNDAAGKRFVLSSSNTGKNEIYINQKDIRNVQLGKGAIITGIDFLLKAAGIKKASRIIVAGAFGSHLDKKDLLTLGVVPEFDPDLITIAGNAAGAGAAMVLCNEHYLRLAENIASNTKVVNLAEDADFHKAFIERLSF